MILAIGRKFFRDETMEVGPCPARLRSSRLTCMRALALSTFAAFGDKALAKDRRGISIARARNDAQSEEAGPHDIRTTFEVDYFQPAFGDNLRWFARTLFLNTCRTFVATL